MQFDIPGWLRDWLNGLNWDILGWEVYVGAAILSGIDWLLSFINLSYDWAQTAFNWAQSAYQNANDLFNAANTIIQFWVVDFTNKLDLLRSQIGAGFGFTVSDILAWIGTAVDQAIAGLGNILSLDVFLLWWGHVGTTFTDWWDSARASVLEAVEATVKPIRDQVNQSAGAIELLTSPGDAALRWLWDRITTAIVRLW